MRDKHELHDALLTLGILPARDLGRGAGEPDPSKWSHWLNELAGDGRAARVEHAGGTAWAATEMLPLAAAAFPDLRRSREGGNPSPAGTLSHSPSTGEGPGEGEDPPTQDEAELVLVRSRTESTGPFTPDQIAASLGMKRGAVDIALAHLEATGNILGVGSLRGTRGGVLRPPNPRPHTPRDDLGLRREIGLFRHRPSFASWQGGSTRSPGASR